MQAETDTSHDSLMQLRMLPTSFAHPAWNAPTNIAQRHEGAEDMPL
ncbi:MAG: hypothetical protein ACE5NW_13905 [Acidiferrobacterales bacterium]